VPGIRLYLKSSGFAFAGGAFLGPTRRRAEQFTCDHGQFWSIASQSIEPTVGCGHGA
jgi:hypothetical protein